MYRLKTESANNIIENLFSFSNVRTREPCLTMKILKMIVIILILRWIYKCVSSRYEFFDISKPNNDNNTSLHDVLTANCKPEYCSALTWTKDKTKLPDGYSVSNYSTADGCCIIPNILTDYINISKGNNATKMTDVSKELKINSYIRE